MAHTDAEGRYKIDVRNAPVTFNVTATMRLTYEGFSVGVNLVPEDPEFVAGGVGGVRNFTFRPKPLTPNDPYGNLACVFVEREAGNLEVDPGRLVLTLKPVGRLADRSTGGVRTTRLVMSGSGWVAANVMWGTYEITATMTESPWSFAGASAASRPTSGA
jgi:hypothetical protein